MRLFKVCLGLFALVNFAFAQVYHTKMNDTEVYIISLGKRNTPISRLLTKEVKEKELVQELSQNPRQNNHNVMLLKHKNFIALVDTGFNDTFKQRAVQTRQNFLQKFKAEKSSIVGIHMPFYKPLLLS